MEELFAPANEQKKNLERTAAQLAEFIAIEGDELDAIKKDHAKRKDNLDATKTQLAELLLQNGLSSIKLTNGLSPSATTQRKFFWQAELEDDDKFSYLRNIGLGDIIKPTVNFNTMQAAMRDYVEAGGEIKEDMINVKSVASIRMNGKAKFLANHNPEPSAG